MADLEVLLGYNPSQARVPKGSPAGGQWIDTPGQIGRELSAAIGSAGGSLTEDEWDEVRGLTAAYKAQPSGAPRPTTAASDAAAAALIQRARAVEPEVTREIRDIVAQQGGEMRGINLDTFAGDESRQDFRIKSERSLSPKIQKAADKAGIPHQAAAATISDSVRYTAVFSEGNFTDSAETLVSRFRNSGYQVTAKNNFDARFEPSNPYRGLNLSLTHPNGHKIEVQVHTATSFNVKMGDMHTWYEMTRYRGNTTEDRRVVDLLNRASWQESGRVSIPSGVERLTEFPPGHALAAAGNTPGVTYVIRSGEEENGDDRAGPATGGDLLPVPDRPAGVALGDRRTPPGAVDRRRLGAGRRVRVLGVRGDHRRRDLPGRGRTDDVARTGQSLVLRLGRARLRLLLTAFKDVSGQARVPKGNPAGGQWLDTPGEVGRDLAAAMPDRKAWQTPWGDLSDDQRAAALAQRGQPPGTNRLTGQPYTDAEIAERRARWLKEGETGREDVVARITEDGTWRPVTDAERQQIGIEYGKPVPPGWSDVFVYTGSDAADRQVTVKGLDWSFKQQPFQSAAQRERALTEKFTRAESLTRAMPNLVQRTATDAATSDVALVTRMMALSGGRVDSGGSRTARGISSLTGRDVRIDGDRVTLDFPGKSGQRNTYTFTDKVVADRLREAVERAGPGGRITPGVSSARTLDYIRRSTGNSSITNHDLRTHVANVAASRAIGEYQRSNPINPADRRSVNNLVRFVRDRVGQTINDSGTVAYNSYINPNVFTQAGIDPGTLPGRGAA